MTREFNQFHFTIKMLRNPILTEWWNLNKNKNISFNNEFDRRPTFTGGGLVWGAPFPSGLQAKALSLRNRFFFRVGLTFVQVSSTYIQ